MKKVLIVLSIILILILILFIVTRVYYNNVGVKPNDLYLNKENSEEMFKASMGTYSWNDKGISVIADSVGPLQIDFTKLIDVKAGEKLYFSDENWSVVSAFAIIAEERKEMARVTIEANLEEKCIIVPEFTPGEYVIQINLESEKGDVWYAAKINITE